MLKRLCPLNQGGTKSAFYKYYNLECENCPLYGVMGVHYSGELNDRTFENIIMGIPLLMGVHCV